MTQPQGRWRQIEELYLAALERPEEQRSAFVRDACGDDSELLSEVESLLLHDRSASFLDGDALAIGARLMAAAERASLTGTTLGPYRLDSLLGAGGMGQVYLAEDMRLRRQVAVKVLPRSFSADAERRLRFVREARSASALNHPNVVTVHDVGQSGPIDYFVMEFVRGETLAQRLHRGPLPFHDAVRYAIQIVSALEAAHAAGVIHRDLKPGNIMITAEDTVKVLDFGLAKNARPAAGEPGTGLTSAATIIGTVAYMSPEQAKGRAVDVRSDIFSFGAVLYEMFTGYRRFPGASNISTLAALLTPDAKQPRSQVRTLPRGVEAILRRALARDPDRRWQSMTEVKSALEALARGRTGGIVSRRAAAAAAALLILGGAWWWWPTWRRLIFHANRAVLLTNYPGQELYPSFSPDGLKIAFTWSREGEADIYVKTLDAPADPVRLTMDRAREAYSRWSPDGRSIAYTAGSAGNFRLRLAPSSGGRARELGQFAYRCIDWTPDSQWILATAKAGTGGQLVRVSAATGEIQPIAYEADQWTPAVDVCPAVSPDGRRVAFSRTDPGGRRGDLHLVSIDGGPLRRLTHRDQYISGLTWAPDGKEIVFHSTAAGHTGLFRIRADDPASAEPNRVKGAGEFGQYPAFAGALWRGPPRLVYSAVNLRNVNLARVDFANGSTETSHMLTEGRGDDFRPAISADGRRVAFVSDRTGKFEVWSAAAAGGGEVQLTRCGCSWIKSLSWSPDGSLIALNAAAGGGVEHKSNAFVVSSHGGPLRGLAPEPAGAAVLAFGPDGRSIYIKSDHEQAAAVYRAPWSGRPHATEMWQRAGGQAPVSDGILSSDGQLLIYTRTDRLGVFAIPLEGGAERALLPSQSAGVLQVAGDYLYYVEGSYRTLLSTGPQSLRRIEISSGRDEAFAVVSLRMAKDLSPDDARLFAIAPDASFGIFPHARGAADLMLVDRFR